MYSVGVIHGRFQPLHLGHMKYLLAGMRRVDFMYIGISNPDPILTSDDPSDIHRSAVLANPCTYFERLHMLKGALGDEGYSQDRFCITPFPINYPGVIQYYTPSAAVYFLTIYDDWGERKLEILQGLGLKTEVLWRSENKGITGTEVRDRIYSNETWANLVPPATVRVMKHYRIEERIKN